MLFAIKYGPSGYNTDEDKRRVRQLFVAWEAPTGVDIECHYHYVSGGGVIVVDTDSAALLFEALEPFKPSVHFHVEPVINALEAVAISMDVEEWANSVVASQDHSHSHGSDGHI
jgi:hypothetical protein